MICAMFDHATVIGDGQMGTVLAQLLAESGLRVRMWCHDPQRAAALKATRENARYMPGLHLSERVSFTIDPTAALAGAEVVISAVPCQYLRGVWQRFAADFPRDVPVVSVTKGIEVDSLLCPVEVIRSVVGGVQAVVLSGPNIASELARRLPATMVAACGDAGLAERVQRTFSTAWLRVYTNPDLIGVELAGALKNVIALAAGILDGLGAGDNAKAALITRGLVEISRLGVAMGAKRETFSGLAGMGDLITTCVSPSGRNRTAGEAIGRGRPVQDVIASTPSVIEGIPTTRSATLLGQRYGVELPITEAVHSVLFEGKDVIVALGELMSRGLREEN